MKIQAKDWHDAERYFPKQTGLFHPFTPITHSFRIRKNWIHQRAAP